MKLIRAGVFVLIVSCSAVLSAQTPSSNAAPARSQVAGTVTKTDAASKRVSIKTDKGDAVTVQATDRTLVLRIPPGETDPKKGSKISVGDIGAGDRVVAVSKQPIEGASVDASAILVMSKSDVAQLQEKEQEEWQKRGAGGTVVSVDPAAHAITLKAGQRTLTIEPSAKTEYRRYAPDSARFSDAKASSFAEIKPGDQMRVLGDRDPQAGTVKAEKIVFGTFRQLAATITSIDAATGELTVKDLATKKPLTIRVTADSTMKKLPEMAARMLARRYAPGAQNAPGADAGGRGAPGQGEPGRGRGMGRGGDIGQMLDALPAMPLSELKPGDAIMVTTTMGSDPSRVTATMLLAGVEPLLTAAPNTATRDIMSGWNLGGGTGGEGQ